MNAGTAVKLRKLHNEERDKTIMRRKNITVVICSALCLSIILLTLIIPARSEDTSLQMKQLDFNEMSYYQNAASLYKDSGKAEHWSLNDKLQMLIIMKDHELLTGVQVPEQPLSMDANDSAGEFELDHILKSYFGTSAPSLLDVFEREWGRYLVDWTPEQTVYYHQLLDENGLGAETRIDFAIPQQETDIDRDHAVEEAFRLTAEKFGLNEEQQNALRLEECYFSYISEGQTAWTIIFTGNQGTENITGDAYLVRLAGDGRVLQTEGPSAQVELFDEFNQLFLNNGAFVTWSVEQKFDFVKVWRERVQHLLIEQPEVKARFDGSYMDYLLSIDFRLPQVDSIPNEKAADIAVNAIAESYRLSRDELIQRYDTCFSFVSRSDNSLAWRVFLVPRHRFDTHCSYKVDLDAVTGSLIEMIQQDAKDSEFATYYE